MKLYGMLKYDKLFIIRIFDLMANFFVFLKLSP